MALLSVEGIVHGFLVRVTIANCRCFEKEAQQKRDCSVSAYARSLYSFVNEMNTSFFVRCRPFKMDLMRGLLALLNKTDAVVDKKKPGASWKNKCSAPRIFRTMPTHIILYTMYISNSF